MAENIIKKIRIKHINVTLKHVTKSLQRYADIKTPNILRQDNYTMKKRTKEHSEKMKKNTEHITILISETALLNTKI